MQGKQKTLSTLENSMAKIAILFQILRVTIASSLLILSTDFFIVMSDSGVGIAEDAGSLGSQCLTNLGLKLSTFEYDSQLN